VTPDDLERTPLAGRNRLTCDECDKLLDRGDRLARTVRWGFWDDEAQSYEGAPYEDHYCQPCWSEQFKRDAAAHYEVTDPERFWSVLEAADGQLVADLRPMFVGGRPWIRVADGTIQALHATKVMREQGDQRVLEFGVEQSDGVDREWFDETFDHVDDHEDDAIPQLALLKPADETPFAEYEHVDDAQQRLTEEA